MPVLDWTLPRKKNNLSKFYKIDVISMTDQDSFAPTVPAAERPGWPTAHGTLRKVKSLNDLLENDVGDHHNISKTASGEISKPAGPEVGSTTETQEHLIHFDQDEVQRQSVADQSGSTERWADQLRQRGDKKPTGQFIVSGFSTLSRRAGGGS